MSYEGVKAELRVKVRESIRSKPKMSRDLMTFVMRSKRTPLTITDLCREVKPFVGEITPQYMRRVVEEMGYVNRLISVNNKVYRAIAEYGVVHSSDVWRGTP